MKLEGRKPVVEPVPLVVPRAPVELAPELVDKPVPEEPPVPVAPEEFPEPFWVPPELEPLPELGLPAAPEPVDVFG
jgi:hypothetical protein